MTSPDTDKSDPWLTAAQVVKICPDCAMKMVKMGRSKIRRSVLTASLQAKNALRGEATTTKE